MVISMGTSMGITMGNRMELSMGIAMGNRMELSTELNMENGMGFDLEHARQLSGRPTPGRQLPATL